MRKVLSKITKTLAIVLVVLFIPLIFCNVYMSVALANKQALPRIFGFATAVIVTGSMSGTIEVGDIVVVRGAKSYAVGDIVLYSDGGPTPICHRIVGKSGEKFITKGDANNIEDSDPVEKDHILGKVIFVVPKLGALALGARSPWAILLFGVLLCGLVIWPVFKRKEHLVE